MKKHVPYKYDLHSRLQRMPHEEYELAMAFLPQFLRVHKQTFRNWIYIKQDNPWEIPANAIIKLAMFFECTPADLITNKGEEYQLNVAWENFRRSFESPEELILSLNEESNVQD